MDVQSPLVADSEPSEVAEPSQSSLHHPTVLAQLLAALDPSSGNTRSDASLSECRPVRLRVVSLVGVQLARSSARSTSSFRAALDGRNSIDHHLQGLGVVNVSSSASHRKGNSASTDHKMALRAWFALIRRRRPDGLAPFLARIVAESKDARDQSISPSACSRSSKTLCSFSHTPALCQSRSLRQQVMPLAQPISCGSISHCKPVLSTNKIPVSAALLEMRGRPPLGLGGSAGKSGSITSHNSSVSSGFAIPYSTNLLRFC
jgi:hypothetical protein